jgi:hypothetical protein
MQKRKRKPTRVGLHIKWLIRMETGQRARGHIANSVIASFSSCEPNVGQQVKQIRYLPEGDEVILYILAGGEVPLASAEIVCHASQLAHLLRGQPSTRHLRPHHLDTGLPLAVDAAPQPEGPELIVRQLPSEKRIGLRPEQLDILPNCSIVLMLSQLVFRKDFGSSHILYFPIENIIIRFLASRRKT